jgi:hypothetical protein
MTYLSPFQKMGPRKTKADSPAEFVCNQIDAAFRYLHLYKAGNLLIITHGCKGRPVYTDSGISPRKVP